MNRSFVTPLFLAAVSCANPSLLAVSAEVDSEQTGAGLTTVAPPPAFVARTRSVITAGEHEILSLERPSVGDIDGDGTDDFIVAAPSSSKEDADSYGYRVYLFYGRADFPEQLSTRDAAASFDAGQRPSVALGDINGDGLADFALGHHDGYELIFGDETRWSGAHEPYASGLAWTWTQLQSDTLLEGLRKLGDIDGDGRDELAVVVTTFDVTPDTAVTTHHVIAGRAAGWPSGTWDASWAVAQLGDEPPVFEDDGATTVVQRLAIMGSGDLDGDGLQDLLALGRWRIWIFYGKEEGLRGTLTTEQADASLQWQFAAEDRVDFAKTLPILIDDLDGDGTAEIGLPSTFELGLAYGSTRRWSGRVRLEPDLTIVRSMGQLAEGYIETNWLGLDQGFALTLPGPQAPAARVSLVTADLDGDGRRELLLQEDLNPWPASPENVVRRFFYSLPFASQHASGRYVLSDRDRYRLQDEADADALSTAVLLDGGGDFDGDGSTDLIFGLTENQATSQVEVSLQLLSGTPNDPD